MAAELLHNRNRALSLGAAIALHAVAIVVLLLFGRSSVPQLARAPALAAMPLRPPPPPPPPDAIGQGAAAPPSRGRTEAPSPPEPPRPLPIAAPAEVAADPGSARASGAGEAPGSGAGQGGVGNGTGAGASGNGTGAARVTPPVRLSGRLTNDDYRAARPPAGAAGTVVVSFTVRTTGRADNCSVIRSSGFAVFDEATCRLIERRFRYRPAADDAGRPIDWAVRTDYTWAPR